MTTRPATPYALIVGWDGVRHDLLPELELPTLSAVAEQGFLIGTTMPEESEAKTSTAPGWSTNLTGVWPAKHGITDNEPMPNHFDRYPHLLQRLLTDQPDRQTLACVCAAMLGSTKGPGPILAGGVSTLIFHDVRTHPLGPIGRDPLVAEDARHQLRHRDYALSFVYFASTDKTAHLEGVGPRYRDAIRQEDSWTGALIDAVRRRPTFSDEDWLVVITTDHGHRDEGGHGGNSWQERQSFLAMARLDADLGFTPPAAVSNVDLAPTVLRHLGVTVEADWDLDGVALQQPSTTVDAGFAEPRLRPGC
ncbi:alkaline phosphatase family protein [Microlunatus soli]|nr:alkaline phosphatase family protein [Microlunatus soli]